SRRRHTRFSRDWSSDVCSSDLLRRLGLGCGSLCRRAGTISTPFGRVHVEKVRPLEPELFSQNYPRGIPGVKKSVGKFPRRKNMRSEEHTSELQSRENLVCRLLLEKKNEMTLISRAVTWKQSSSSD